MSVGSILAVMPTDEMTLGEPVMFQHEGTKMPVLTMTAPQRMRSLPHRPLLAALPSAASPCCFSCPG